MEHQSALRKFLKTILIPQQKDSKKSFLSGGFMQRRIDEKLLTPELKKSGKIFFTLEGDEFKGFEKIQRNLRQDISTEYLKDRELGDALWYLLCDVYLNKEVYRNSESLKRRIEKFIQQICKPLKDYEVIFGVSNLSIKKYPLQIWDVALNKLTKEDLERMELKIGGKLKELLFKKFIKNVVVIIAMQGNNSGFVVERAREKAEFALKVLQVYFNELIEIHDENLLFDVSDFALIRGKEINKWAWSWKRKRSPFGISIGDSLLASITKANDHFKVISYLNPNFQSRVQRAIYWLGSAIEEEAFDHKMIHLCTALESLLTSRSDKRKGEVIAYRMVILNHLTEGNFPDPFRLMWFYELRSRIVHGSAIGQTTKSDYLNLQDITTRTLFSLITQIKQLNAKDYFDLISQLENEVNLKLVKSYFEGFKGEWPQSILQILNEKLEKFK